MKVMMKELGEIITGNTPSKKTEEFWNSEDICFIKPDIIADNGINEIVDSNEYISEDARKKARVVGKNSIFITCIGNIGKLGIASDGEYAFNQQINAIIPNDRVQPKYLAYNLLFNKARLVAMANAPVVPIINKSQFGEFTVNIETDIDRQNETVDVLDKLTQIIQQRNKEISALDELIKARFVEMFTSIKKEQLLGDISEFVTVGIANSATHAYTDSGIPMLRNQNIKENHLDDSDLIYINPEFAAKYESKKLKENDIIVMRTGYPGVACLVPSEYEGCQTFTTLIVRLKEDNNPRYVCSYINSDLGKSFIESEKVGVAQQNVGAKSLAKMPIRIAPKDLQDEYVAFVAQVDKSKAAVQKALDETQLLFDSLMQEYFG